MTPETNTFIPHENKVKTQVRFGSAFLVLTLIVFIVSLVIAGASFFLRTSSAAQLVSYQDGLNRSKERFNEGLPIRSIEEFDSRLRASRDLLARHKSFDGLFSLIERVTLTNVQFTSFSYSEIDNTRKNVVHLVGRAPDYKTIAEESEQFSLDADSRRYITDVVFSNLSVDQKTGLISFEIVFTVDPEFLLYGRYVTPDAAGSVTPDTTSDTVPSARGSVPNVTNQ